MRKHVVIVVFILLESTSYLCSQCIGDYKIKRSIVFQSLNQINKFDSKKLENEMSFNEKDITREIPLYDSNTSYKFKSTRAHLDALERKEIFEKDKISKMLQEGESSKKKYFVSLKGYRDINTDKNKYRYRDIRTRSYFVFAFGLNNTLISNKLKSINDSAYKTLGSYFYELGWTWNTRVFKNISFLHVKYGASLMYNNLSPNRNNYFVKNGDKTKLEKHKLSLDVSRLRNVYLAVPLYIEIDLSPTVTYNGVKYARTHKSLRFGIGGYTGFKLKTKQKLIYKNKEDQRVRELIKGDFNTETLNYGLGTYIGYRGLSLYVKYDLPTVFKGTQERNISAGLRMDL